MLPGRKRALRPDVVVPATSDNPRVLLERLRPRLDAGQATREVAAPGQVDAKLAIRETFEMDVRVNESGPHGAPQPNHLGAATRCSTRFWADGDDAAVKRRHLGRTSCEQDRLDQRPYDLAMISFMISSVPAPILASRASRHALSTGNSRM